MTIPASTIPGVKAYLFTQTVALINDDKVLVCYDEPGTNHPDDIVVIGGTLDREITIAQMVGSGGAGWLDEVYSLDTVISVFRGGNQPQTAFERACVLADAVVQVVRTDPSLGSRVIVARPQVARYDPEWDEKHKGRLVTITQPIYVHARI